jgi:hypothetical protein
MGTAAQVPTEQGKSREVGYCKPPVEHQFKPGQSGNPEGLRKGRTPWARLIELLEKNEVGGKPIGDGRQVADLVAEAMLKTLLKGNSQLIINFLDRTEGKVAERVEVGGSDEKPIRHVHRIEFVEVIVPEAENGDGDDGGKRVARPSLESQTRA